MKKIPLECKIDDNGILYIDDKNILHNYISNYRNRYYRDEYIRKNYFFRLSSTNDYIIKYHVDKLSRRQVIKMLYKFYQIDNQSLLDIDLPIGYYKENNVIKGLIVPNYEKSPSVTEVCMNNNLSKYYSYSDDQKENILYMLSNIIRIVKLLYEHGVIYTDINPGNFVISDNDIKIIDFDPKYLFYDDPDNYYLNKLLSNYRYLVHYVFEKLDFNENEAYNFIDDDYQKIRKYASMGK